MTYNDIQKIADSIKNYHVSTAKTKVVINTACCLSLIDKNSNFVNIWMPGDGTGIQVISSDNNVTKFTSVLDFLDYLHANW